VAESYVLDTSALLAYLQDEAGADTVMQILSAAQRRQCVAHVSFITLAELYYVTWQEEGESAAKELIALVKSLPLSTVESCERLTLSAGRIKANHRLSLGDAFVAATALQVQGTLVHKDPEFEQVKGLVTCDPLPYKVRGKP